METIIEKIKKIRELAERGEQGEAIAAKHKLELLLKKYGLDINDIEKDKKTNRLFKYKGSWNKKLVIQTVASCCNYDIKFFKSRLYPGHIIAELTDLEYAEANNKLEFHRKQFEKERRKAEKVFFSAYIHQHDLFGFDNGKNSERKISLDEIQAIVSMMNNLEQVSYLKGLNKLNK